jgi:copper chaperone
MLKLKVDGMTCDHCVKAVTRAASGTPGVEKVRSVDLKSGEVLLDGSPDPAALVRAIAAAGYTAHPLA